MKFRFGNQVFETRAEEIAPGTVLAFSDSAIMVLETDGADIPTITRHESVREGKMHDAWIFRGEQTQD